MTLLDHLQPFENKEHILVHNQSVGDIISGLLATHRKYKSEYDKTGYLFKGKNEKEIAYKIWKFLKRNVKYVIEPEDRQLLKSPTAILQTGHTTGSDCKNLSLWTGGCLDALNRKGYKINWCYRFASYRIGDKVPQHVFVVINPDTNNEIWVDAVLPKFNQKKQYFYKIDKKVKMPLIALSGIDDNAQVNGIFDGLKKSLKKLNRKDFFNMIKKAIKDGKNFVLALGLTVPRNAFLVCVRLNFKALATNLDKAFKKDPEKVKLFWRDLGGDWTKLKMAIENGKKEKMLGYMPRYPQTMTVVEDYTQYAQNTGLRDYGKIGEPATVTASAVTSAPIIVKALNFLKKMGIKPEDLQALAKSAEPLLDSFKKKMSKDIDNEANGIPTETGNSIVEGVQKAKDKPGKTFKINTPILLGAAAAATILYITTKRK